VALLAGCSTGNVEGDNEVQVKESRFRESVNSDHTSYPQEAYDLLSKMTLKEKIGQMNQYNGFWDFTGPTPEGGAASKKYEHLRSGMVGSMLNVRGVENVRAVQKIAVEETRLGIPLIIGFDVIHGYKTMAPIPLAEAASWDLEAIEASAAMAATEAAAAGINWTFAPMIDISRDARWGRVMEGAGEDPYLGSLIAQARVRGFQGDDLSAVNTIAACAKHFAGYGFAEAGRDYNTVDVGTSTLYNTIFPPFQAAIDADVKTFMNSFNELNGVPATANSFLLRDVLKDEWDYDGFVVSDWNSIGEMIAHGFAKDGEQAALMAARAGSDMDMEAHLYVQHLEKLITSGKLDETLIDDAVLRILAVKMELGLFDNPYKYLDENREVKLIGAPKHLQTVLEMAKKSIVLLKNEGALLPLPKTGKKIALIGDLADDKNSPLGSWRIAADDNTAVSVLEGMQKYSGNQLKFAQGVKLVESEELFIKEIRINEVDKSAFAKAKQTAADSDIVVMVLGEHGFQSGEGRSRANLDLPGLQQELLEEVYSVNQNIVLVLNNGRPLALPWAAENIPAIVEAWHLGSQHGNAVAEVLYGDYNPSGKLPMTFPRSVGQVPLYYNYKNTGRPVIPEPDLVFWSHYTDEENTPLFPFGHGLSYTDFEISNIGITSSSADGVTLSATVQNTGNLAGRETVQVYVRDHYASITRPVKELCGFKSVLLNPKESQSIEITVSRDQLGFYDKQGDFKVEKGDFTFYVGSSSTDVKSINYELK